MNDEEKKLQKRFEELASRAVSRACWTNTEFLTTAEQSLLQQKTLDAPFTFCGGYDGAERRLALFGSEELCGYTELPPLVCLKLSPTAPKFAETLTHRDFLGALMGLGIRREVLGDIVLQENEAYLFCLDSIAPFIVENCTQIRRTAVSVSRVESLPKLFLNEPAQSEIVVSSLRLDALVAAVWKLSRSETKRLVENEKVFVNSRLSGNPSAELKENDMVSVRGLGRFLCEGVTAETRKGRLRVTVRKY